MARKRKFDKVAAIKDASRTHIGPVPVTRRVPNRKRKISEREFLHEMSCFEMREQ